MKSLRLSYKNFYRATLLVSLLLAPRFTVALEKPGIISLKENIILSTANLQPVIEKLTPTEVLFIGENHTVYANHLKQLEIIKALYKKNPNIAIGLEMFTASSDTDIHDYLNQNITEIEFLRKTRYFSEWGYDYHLYKDILDFAQKHNIDVVGLNIKNDIVRKVGRTGFREITTEEFAEIPDQIDFSDESYRKALAESFNHHPDHQSRQPENFYLSQLIRDEYMARSAARYLKANPKKTLIILVGNGHVENGYGIPQRLRRLTGKTGKIIMLDSPYQPGAADFFVYTADIKMTASPRLKIILASETGQMKVGGFTDPQGGAKHALKKDDEILSINEIPVKNIADIRLVLYDKKPGDVVNIAVVRDKQNLTVQYTLEADNED